MCYPSYYGRQPTGKIFPEGLSYQVILEGISYPDNQLDSIVNEYLIDIEKQNQLKNLGFFSENRYKPTKDDKVFVHFSIYEDGNKQLFPPYILSYHSNIYFSLNNIKETIKEYNKMLSIGTIDLEKNYINTHELPNDTELPYSPSNINDILSVLKPTTQFALKRAGDWGQVENCLNRDNKPTKIFITMDRMASLYAISRGVPIMFISFMDCFINRHSREKMFKTSYTMTNTDYNR